MNIIEEVKKVNFPANEYIVVGGAAMAVNGIRETEDLDIVVTPELFERCKREGWELKPWVKSGKQGKDWLKKGNVEVYRELIMSGDSMSVEDLSKDVEIIEGIPFISLSRLLELKKEYLRLYGRPKDVRDIALIEMHLLK